MEESVELVRARLIRIVAALLPRNVREHVLGDLAERGFNLHDIANVLPRVWWSHFRRANAIPFVAESTDADFERRFYQFNREQSVAAALIALSWSIIVTIVYRELAYLVCVFIVLTGIVIWPFIRSSLPSLFSIAPGRDGTWRERHTVRLRRQRTILFGIPIGNLFLDTLGRSVAVGNGHTWPLTDSVTLSLPNMTLHISIPILVLCSLNFLWVCRVHREFRKLQSK
jgi:hypothetical protein